MNSVKAVASSELRIAMTTLDRQNHPRTTKILYLLDAVSTGKGLDPTPQPRRASSAEEDKSTTPRPDPTRSARTVRPCSATRSPSRRAHPSTVSLICCGIWDVGSPGV